MNEFVSWCRHLLVSFLFHALTSLHFIEMIFPLVPLIFHSFWCKAPRYAQRARRLYERACARGEPTRARTRKWRRSVSAVEEPHDLP